MYKGIIIAGAVHVELMMIFTQSSPEAMDDFLLVTVGSASSTTTKALMLPLSHLHYCRHRLLLVAGTA